MTGEPLTSDHSFVPGERVPCPGLCHAFPLNGELLTKPITNKLLEWIGSADLWDQFVVALAHPAEDPIAVLPKRLDEVS